MGNTSILVFGGGELKKWFSLGNLQEVLSEIISHYFPLCLRLALFVANSLPRMDISVLIIVGTEYRHKNIISVHSSKMYIK